MAIGDIYELTTRMTIFTQNVVNVHHLLQSRADGSGKAEDAIDVIWNAIFKTAFKDVMTGDVTIVDLSIRRIKPTQTQPTVYAVGESGSIMSGTLPSNCCAIVRQFAQPAGRKGSGHVKIVGVPQDNINEGRVNAAYATLLNTYGTKFAAEVVDAASGYGFDPAVYSTIDSVARPILKAGAASRVRTVHSRQIGVGD